MANASRPPIPVSSHGLEKLDKSVQVLLPEFRDDPLMLYLLHSIPDATAREAYRPKYQRCMVKAALLQGGSAIEAGGWGACGILVPPNRAIDGPLNLIRAGVLGAAWTLGLSGFRRAFEYQSAAGKAKKEGLTPAELRGGYWYCFIVATASDRRRQGLASAAIGEMKRRAVQDGRPVWLEASTDKSRRVYEKQGFVTTGEMVLGKGVVGADGLPAKGGEGVTVWPMVWRPEGTKEGK